MAPFSKVVDLQKLLRHLELRIAFMAAVALLIAQMGALSHAYSHDAAIDSSTAHRSAVNSHDSCNDCVAYATVLSAAGTPSALPWIESQGRTLATSATARSLIDRRLTLAFRSRAPPVTR